MNGEKWTNWKNWRKKTNCFVIIWPAQILKRAALFERWKNRSGRWMKYCRKFKNWRRFFLITFLQASTTAWRADMLFGGIGFSVISCRYDFITSTYCWITFNQPINTFVYEQLGISLSSIIVLYSKFSGFFPPLIKWV